MAYVTDFTAAPLSMLLGLLNADNDTGFVPADVEALAPVVIETPDAEGRNTSVDIDLLTLPSEVVGDYVTFTYKRVAMEELFSLVTAGVREVDVPVNENGMPVDNAVFYAEILRKYGIAMTDADFDLTLKAQGMLTITAKAANYAYTGAIDVALGSSLATRVSKTVLEGFTAPV